MQPVLLSAAEGLSSVLAIGCHADDIEIGCGGTVLSLMERNPAIEVTWIVLSAHDVRADEARAGAASFLAAAETPPNIVLKPFRDGFFPYTGAEIKTLFEELKHEVAPSLIFTHAGIDLHQDHRLVSELTWNTFRDHLILEFEIPKYDADLSSPNVFVPLSDEIVEKKIELLLDHFPSQRSKHWFTDDLFRAMMRLRGMESNSPTNYAEAFRCRKMLLTH